LIEPASSTKLSRIRPVVPQLSQLGSMHVYAVDEALALSENDGKDQQPKLVDESQIEQGSARAAAAVHRHVFVLRSSRRICFPPTPSMISLRK
jgi:hypothetical protein